MNTFMEKAVHLGRGALAGALATVAMKGVISLLESKKKMGTKEAFSDRKPAEREVIDGLNKRYGWKMKKSRRAIAARGLRLGVGMGTSMVSSYLTRRMGAKESPLKGAALAVLIFVVIDEVIKPAIGVRPSPLNVPFQTHFAALAGHATYGLVNAGTEQVMERVLPEELGLL